MPIPITPEHVPSTAERQALLDALDAALGCPGLRLHAPGFLQDARTNVANGDAAAASPLHGLKWLLDQMERDVLSADDIRTERALIRAIDMYLHGPPPA